MKRYNRYIILSIFFLLLLTGITLIPLCISQFIRFADKHSELHDFYTDHSIYEFNPDDNSGFIELSTPISLPNAGRFTIIVFCYDTTRKSSSYYNVDLNINASINGISNIITLKDESYIISSYYYKGDYVVNPYIDKSWESIEYAINSNLSLGFSWESNFKDWDLYVLYTNDLIEEQRYQIRSSKSDALLAFGLELGFSIAFIVGGAIISIFSIVYILKNRGEQRTDNLEFYSQEY
ncbi:MAG: hypothetical protein ACFFC3_08820 [Candidatus Odinarchaeota archaeon]